MPEHYIGDSTIEVSVRITFGSFSIILYTTWFMFSSAGASKTMMASYLPKMASATMTSLTFSFIL